MKCGVSGAHGDRSGGLLIGYVGMIIVRWLTIKLCKRRQKLQKWLITKSHTDCNMATVVALIKCIFNALLKKTNFTLLWKYSKSHVKNKVHFFEEKFKNEFYLL